MKRPTTQQAAPEPGVLYRDACPPLGQDRMFAVNAQGERCFEVTVDAEAATADRIARWKEDARVIARPPIALVRPLFSTAVHRRD
ncbi:MAG TPA: hypothetical protein VF102_07105 [Gemmatimonadaceae bacterium]